MKIIYISAMISENKFNNIFKKAKTKPLQSIQKYHRLLCQGFLKNGVEVEAISIIPMSRKISSNVIFFDKKEIEKGIKYHYIPFLNLKYIRQIFTFVFTFIQMFNCILKSKKNDLFICDILNSNLSISTILLTKLFNRKSVALVTDLPQDINKDSLSSKINQYFGMKYDGYILLTKYMNDIINKKNKPFIIVEGLVDCDSKLDPIKVNKNTAEKKCIYAGGLYEKYGIKNLIYAFALLPSNYTLYLYGEGELTDFLKNNKFKNVKYMGVVQNAQMMDIQKHSTLLLNPRFTLEDYTKYSFPSKIIEYMSSGTPVLTTKLEGIPDDYYQYLYFFDDTSIDGLKNKIFEVLNYNNKSLIKFGAVARKFVLENKNNKVQAKRVIDLFLAEE